MPGFAFVTPDQAKIAQLKQAAKDCDDLANKLVSQAQKVYSLQDDVRTAWMGDGGASLDNALVYKGSDLTSAAGVLRGVAQEFRTAASKIARQSH